MKFDYLKAESAENGHGFNIQSFGETNQRWNVLPHYKQLRAITEGWWERPSYQIAIKMKYNMDGLQRYVINKMDMADPTREERDKNNNCISIQTV